MSTQPIALYLAEKLESPGVSQLLASNAAAELRRLHAANLFLVEHLQVLAVPTVQEPADVWFDRCFRSDPPAQPATEESSATQPAREPVGLRDALTKALTSTYVCGRVWEAWNVGTMTENDFQPAAECDELLDELVHAVTTIPPAASQPAVQEPVAQWQKRHPARTAGKWKNTDEHDAKWWRDNAQGWDIRALYTNPPAPPVPEGMVLVPMEPTKEMVFAGQDAWSAALDKRLENKEPYGEENKAPMCARVAYRAMLAAAPEKGGAA